MEQYNNEYAGRSDNRPVTGSAEIPEEETLEKETEERRQKEAGEYYTEGKVKNFPYASVPNEYFFDMEKLEEFVADEDDAVNKMDLQATAAVLKEKFPSGKIHLTEKEFAELDPDEQKIIKSLNANRKYKDAA